jgi:hypothetical protein
VNRPTAELRRQRKLGVVGSHSSCEVRWTIVDVVTAGTRGNITRPCGGRQLQMGKRGEKR